MQISGSGKCTLANISASFLDDHFGDFRSVFKPWFLLEAHSTGAGDGEDAGGAVEAPCEIFSAGTAVRRSCGNGKQRRYENQAKHDGKQFLFHLSPALHPTSQLALQHLHY